MLDFYPCFIVATQQGRPLYFAAVVSSSSFFFFFFFSSPNLSGRRLDVYHTLAHGVALVRIQNEGLKYAARGSLKIQDAKICHLRTIAQLCRAISLQLRHVSTIQKNLLNSNISCTCVHNMVNFSPVMTEIGWRVLGTPANVNGFCILALLFLRFDQ